MVLDLKFRPLIYFKFFFKDLFTCVCVWHEREREQKRDTSVSHECRADIGQRRAFRAPEAGVTGACEPPYGCWEPKLSPLLEHSVLLVSEPSLQPLELCFFFFSKKGRRQQSSFCLMPMSI